MADEGGPAVGPCRADMVSNLSACDKPGTVLYRLGSGWWDAPDEVLLCVDHAQIISRIESMGESIETEIVQREASDGQ